MLLPLASTLKKKSILMTSNLIYPLTTLLNATTSAPTYLVGVAPIFGSNSQTPIASGNAFAIYFDKHFMQDYNSKWC